MALVTGVQLRAARALLRMDQEPLAAASGISAATIAAQRARVLAEVERVRFEFSPLGVARRRRAEAQLEAEFQAHRREMVARTAAYQARWGSGVAPAARAA